MLRKWDKLPQNMQNDDVRKYYEKLNRKRGQLLAKLIFDKIMALILLILLSPIMILIAIWIKMDSPGEVFFRQERVTQYGKVFRIHKFRTMVKEADKLGAQVTTSGDARITAVGSKLRSVRLDELPQLIDILQGNMSFVGTRPEVKKYVNHYSNEMFATLLLPAGVTSEASIIYKDEDRLLAGADDVDAIYIKKVLPDKMVINLKSIKEFSFLRDIIIMWDTIKAVI